MTQSRASAAAERMQDDFLHDQQLSDPVQTPLSQRLGRLHPLSIGERRTLDGILRNRRRVAAGTTLIRRGDNSAGTIVICTGMAIRVHHLIDGKRRIFGYCLAGDFADDRDFTQAPIDYDVSVLNDAEVATVSFAALAEAVRVYPAIGRSLQAAALLETRRLREWLLNVAYRSAPRRIAHFLCEIEARMGEAPGQAFGMSGGAVLTQSDLADMLGLTKVHINRSLKQLRQEALIEGDRGRLIIADVDQLRRFAGYNPQLAAQGRCDLAS